MTTFQFDFKDLNLSVSQIEDVVGYNDSNDRALVSDLINETLHEAQSICEIRAQYTIFPDVRFDIEPGLVVINNSGFQIKKIVYAQLKKADSIAIFLCTAGGEIGIRSRRAMQERDLLKGYILDVIGSEVVEAAADLMQDELGKEADLTGKKITNRYSPGYCGWDVADQHKLFQLLPDNFCKIKLTQSALMDPVKSVSGFIGVGVHVKKNPYTCRMCEMQDCIYRRVREKKNV